MVVFKKHHNKIVSKRVTPIDSGGNRYACNISNHGTYLSHQVFLTFFNHVPIKIFFKT